MRALSFAGAVAILLSGCAISDDGSPATTAALTGSAAQSDPSAARAAESETAEAGNDDPADGVTTLASETPVENAGASDDAPSGNAGSNIEMAAAEADLAGGNAEDGADAASAAPALDDQANGASDVASGPPVVPTDPSLTNEPAEVDQSARTPALAVVEPAEERPSPFARLFSKQPSETSAEAEAETEAAPATASAARPAGASASDESGSARARAETDDLSQLTTASIAGSGRRAQLSVTVGDDEPLPGVRQVSSLYEIGRRDSFDLHDYEDAEIQVASAAGLAGLAGGRLAVQHARVDVSCLKPKLVQTLRQIERRFGKPVVVTSGYRNRSYNRQVGGARESKHMSCEAADIQVAGVSKWDIAEYVRTLPGRGGVGTYCHTESVHVDIGSKRDWNWRCRRRK